MTQPLTASASETARLARVEAALGNAGEICTRCHATLWTYADVCSADLSDPCPGFQRIEEPGRKEIA